MIFPTEVNNQPCICKVRHYTPPTGLQITGSGFGDAEPGECEEFDFELFTPRMEPWPSLTKKATPEDIEQLLHDFLVLNQDDFYIPYD